MFWKLLQNSITLEDFIHSDTDELSVRLFILFPNVEV